MANVISNFLVGLGFDYDNKGAKQFDSGMDQLVSKGKKLGVVLGGAFGFKNLTADFAQSKDQLGKFSNLMSVNANDVQAWGNALQSQGGSLDGVLSQIENIERKRSSVQTGDTGWFGEAGKARIDPSIVTGAKNATDAILNLSTAFEKLTPQQRLNAGQALGFDKPMITLLSKGRVEVEQIVSHFKEVQPLTADMTKSAAEFNKQWVEAKANISAIVDTVSEELLPVVNDVVDGFNNMMDGSRGGFLGSVTELTKQTFGKGDAENTEKVTGMPSWLFKPVEDLPSMAMNGISDWWNNDDDGTPKKPHPLYGGSDVTGTIASMINTIKPSNPEAYVDSHGTATRPDAKPQLSGYSTATNAKPQLSGYSTAMNAKPDKPDSSMFNYGDIMNAKPDKPLQPKITVNSPMQQNTRPIKNDITVKLDGAVIDRRISTVIERAADTALSQIETNIRS